ncbi:carbon-nitrogen hydrolase family protein [Gordonia sp. HY442]|uniref:carbon-nitrogen hydrolase family protein n=1 Tax=Gordonia zhenghanii TaxID=2911516 RepID=UPI001F222FBE|nr:carbon-nitrogen hydrolase family protein [Gordonia zhenghanii]MCF8603291.1 carbon-nitrogen hydrolase family protein [Gordonia zhenghanii]
MRLAMAQISTGTDPQGNLTRIVDETRRAARDGAELIVFPEASMCRFGVSLRDVAQPLDGPWASGVSDVADETGVTVVAGMFTTSPDGRIRNTLVVARPGLERLAYDKIHLFDAFGFRESDTIAAGDEPLVFDLGGHRIGVATCYDIRFPELFTELARRGAQLVVVPASWGAGPGKLAQWQLLASARALDSVSYVAAVGQASPADAAVRESSAPTGIGHSRISDPFGSVVADYDSGERVDLHDLDLSRTDKARTALATLANRRDIPRLDGTDAK